MLSMTFQQQPLTEAYAPAHEAFVAVENRPRRFTLLPANLAGQVGPGSHPVQRLV